MVWPRGWLIVSIAVVIVLAACSESSTSGEEGGAERQADEIVADAAVAMADVESAAFTIEQTGATIFIDDGGQLGFLSAVGRYAGPSSAEAILDVTARGFTTQVGAKAIAGTVWFTNPLTGAWAEAPDGFTFDLATVFDEQLGFPALLSEATATAELVDDEADDGDGDGDGDGDAAGDGLDSAHHVRAAVTAERVAVLTGGLITEGTDVEVWIDMDTNRVIEARFDLPVDDATSSWRMTVGDYDEEVVIEPPELDAEG